MAARKSAPGTGGIAAPEEPVPPDPGAEGEETPPALPPEAPGGSKERGAGQHELEPAPPDPSAETDAEEGTPAPQPQAQDTRPFDLNELLGNLSTEERAALRKHPLVAGIAGQIAQTQVERLVNERIAQIEAEREEAEDAVLLEQNPDQFVERAKTRKERRDQARQIAGQRSQWETTERSAVMGAIQRFQEELPEEAQGEIRGKRYDGSFHDGLYSYIKDVADVATKHRVRAAERTLESKLRPKIEAELRPKIEQEFRERGLSSEPSTKGPKGGAATNGVITQDIWNANRHDREWRKTYRDQVNLAIQEGRIRS